MDQLMESLKRFGENFLMLNSSKIKKIYALMGENNVGMQYALNRGAD